MTPGAALVSRGRLFGGAETPLSRGFIVLASPPVVVATDFFFDSVKVLDAITIRARFSSPPLTGSGAASTRGDLPANWQLIDPNGHIIQVQTATKFAHDPEVIDLGLFQPLKARGAHQLSVVATILDIYHNQLSAKFRV